VQEIKNASQVHQAAYTKKLLFLVKFHFILWASKARLLNSGIRFDARLEA
jgi:hypothetical protein